MTRSQMFRAMMLALLALAAMPPAFAQQVPLQDKPFAEHKIVLQLSDGDARKQALVLSVANNLLKAYAPTRSRSRWWHSDPASTCCCQTASAVSRSRA
ncbi:hypothetical protein NK6_3409 [Bradyrhizobium diazoefficiens]|uniref:Uncharacterized protein n=1 Tax=Bradyrhizobium diazoefficiens TaxID=1355477 RepID=A0A0E4BP15_9BRAD|nr:hypothetical protein NK6_3409 [Bradyrhizobium diazoefficiens]